MWLAAGLAGLLTIATGLLPVREALSVRDRTWSVLVFLVTITVVAELSDAAGVFDAAANQAARLARGSRRRLFLLIALLVSFATIVISLAVRYHRELRGRYPVAVPPRRTWPGSP
ncbi:MAG: SLC13 family permease [Actinomycetes bacterium]